MKRIFLGSAAALFLMVSCSTVSSSNDSPTEPIANETAISAETTTPDEKVSEETSRVTAVEATPSGSGYSFAVTIESDEAGCDRYADWWEVVTPEGELLYRRILAHSHVDEQPFTRSGGPVLVGEEDVWVVRSHTNTDGYSTQVMQGSIGKGFSPTTLSADFAPELAEAEPRPSGCAF